MTTQEVIQRDAARKDARAATAAAALTAAAAATASRQTRPTRPSHQCMVKGQRPPPGRPPQRRGLGGWGAGGMRGRRGGEPFVGRLFTWHNCHGGGPGAWNKTLLITQTRVRIE